MHNLLTKDKILKQRRTPLSSTQTLLIFDWNSGLVRKEGIRIVDLELRQELIGGRGRRPVSTDNRMAGRDIPCLSVPVWTCCMSNMIVCSSSYKPADSNHAEKKPWVRKGVPNGNKGTPTHVLMQSPTIHRCSVTNLPEKLNVLPTLNLRSLDDLLCRIEKPAFGSRFCLPPGLGVPICRAHL